VGCAVGHARRRFRIAFSLEFWTLAQTLVNRLPPHECAGRVERC
jgi:hypothetical protein